MRQQPNLPLLSLFKTKCINYKRIATCYGLTSAFTQLFILTLVKGEKRKMVFEHFDPFARDGEMFQKSKVIEADNEYELFGQLGLIG